MQILCDLLQYFKITIDPNYPDQESLRALDKRACWEVDISNVSAENQLTSWHRIVLNLDSLPIAEQA